MLTYLPAFKGIEVETDGYVGIFFKNKCQYNQVWSNWRGVLFYLFIIIIFNNEDIICNLSITMISIIICELSKPFKVSERFEGKISFEDDLSDTTLYYCCKMFISNIYQLVCTCMGFLIPQTYIHLNVGWGGGCWGVW